MFNTYIYDLDKKVNKCWFCEEESNKKVELKTNFNFKPTLLSGVNTNATSWIKNHENKKNNLFNFIYNFSIFFCQKLNFFQLNQPRHTNTEKSVDHVLFFLLKCAKIRYADYFVRCIQDFIKNSLVVLWRPQ